MEFPKILPSDVTLMFPKPSSHTHPFPTAKQIYNLILVCKSSVVRLLNLSKLTSSASLHHLLMNFVPQLYFNTYYQNVSPCVQKATPRHSYMLPDPLAKPSSIINPKFQLLSRLHLTTLYPESLVYPSLV
jgi:hypothetical protein